MSIFRLALGCVGSLACYALAPWRAPKPWSC